MKSKNISPILSNPQGTNIGGKLNQQGSILKQLSKQRWSFTIIITTN